jgi:TonB family protein
MIRKGFALLIFLCLLIPVSSSERKTQNQTPVLNRFCIVDRALVWSILDVQQIDNGILVRLIQIEKGTDPCGDITTKVKAIEKSISQISPSKLVGNNNPCTISADVIHRSTKANEEILGPKLGVIASCGDEERSIFLPSMKALNIINLLPDFVDGFRVKDEYLYAKNVAYQKNQEPQIAALGYLEEQIAKIVFGDAIKFDQIYGIMNYLNAEHDDKLQQFGQSLIPELRSGKYDKGLFRGNEYIRASESSFREILRDYVLKEKVPVYSGKLVHAEQFHFIKYVAPPYPELALRARVSGNINLELVVDPQTGNTSDAHVISGHSLLEDAAVKAALQWQFDPSLQKLEQSIKLTLNFSFQCPSHDQLK